MKIDPHLSHWGGRLLLAAITIYLWRIAYSSKVKSQFAFLLIAVPAIFLSFLALYYLFDGLGVLEIH